MIIEGPYGILAVRLLLAHIPTVLDAYWVMEEAALHHVLQRLLGIHRDLIPVATRKQGLGGVTLTIIQIILAEGSADGLRPVGEDIPRVALVRLSRAIERAQEPLKGREHLERYAVDLSMKNPRVNVLEARDEPPAIALIPHRGAGVPQLGVEDLQCELLEVTVVIIDGDFPRAPLDPRVEEAAREGAACAEGDHGGVDFPVLPHVEHHVGVGLFVQHLPKGSQ
jgi:hypothetical protein